jgi:hypothetical protein
MGGRNRVNLARAEGVLELFNENEQEPLLMPAGPLPKRAGGMFKLDFFEDSCVHLSQSLK